MTGKVFFVGDIVKAVNYDRTLHNEGLRAETLYEVTEMATLGPGVWLNAAILQNVETKKFVQVSVSTQFLQIVQRPVKGP